MIAFDTDVLTEILLGNAKELLARALELLKKKMELDR